MNGFYITSTGDKVILEQSEIIELSGRDIIELVLPDGVGVIWCWNNKLTELVIPNGVKQINCSGNQLTELIIPDNCRVYCDPSVKLITRTMFNRSKRLKNLLK